MSGADFLVLVHLAATLTMFGVIWMVQVVHYPLFASVGADGFAAYEASHQTRIMWIVLPAMVLELGTALALVWQQPSALPGWAAWIGFGLVGIVWVSTMFVQVPLHTVLSAGFDESAHARLVSSNWVRTVAWTLRAGLALWMTARFMR